jgi:hypothetical protein
MPIVFSSGSLKLLEPSGLLEVCTWIGFFNNLSGYVQRDMNVHFRLNVLMLYKAKCKVVYSLKLYRVKAYIKQSHYRP